MKQTFAARNSRAAILSTDPDAIGSVTAFVLASWPRPGNRRPFLFAVLATLGFVQFQVVRVNGGPPVPVTGDHATYYYTFPAGFNYSAPHTEAAILLYRGQSDRALCESPPPPFALLPVCCLPSF